MKSFWLVFCTLALAISALPLFEPNSPLALMNHLWSSGTVWSWISISFVGISVIGVAADALKRGPTFTKRLSLRYLQFLGVLLMTFIPWDAMAVNSSMLLQIFLMSLGSMIVLLSLILLSVDSADYKSYSRSVFSRLNQRTYSSSSITKTKHSTIKPKTGRTTKTKQKPSTPKAPPFPTNTIPSNKRKLKTKSTAAKKTKQIVTNRSRESFNLDIKSKPGVLRPSIPRLIPANSKSLPPPIDMSPTITYKEKPPKIGGDDFVPRDKQVIKPMGQRDLGSILSCTTCGTDSTPYGKFCKECGSSFK